ncbi:MAG TPA: hypothetical protein VFH45_13120 [Acidimicrobiales bacterium]|nr:hypothetical protein [Acidimicrobiales bacterium]
MKALREVADAADATSREQHRAAGAVRRIADRRERGASWRDISASDSALRVVELLAGGASRLREAAGRLRRVIAGGLADEGMTTRKIGERFGVSHQRVSTLLSRGEDD